MRYATQWPRVNNADEIQQLGVVLREPRETFIDTLRWLGETGLLDKKLLPKLFEEKVA